MQWTNDDLIAMGDELRKRNGEVELSANAVRGFFTKQPKGSISGEQALWIEVLVQAWRDVAKPPRYSKSQKTPTTEREKALADDEEKESPFYFVGTDGFHSICGVLGLDAAFVKMVILCGSRKFRPDEGLLEKIVKAENDRAMELANGNA